MAGRIQQVRPGAQAESALAAEIRRVQSGDRLAPVSVVVRTPAVGLALRRRLVEDGSFAAVSFLTLPRLWERLGSAGAAMGGRLRPLDEVALRAALRAALGVVPGMFWPVAAHPATEAALAAAYRELRRAGADRLDQVASGSGRAADVVALVRQARELLVGYYDAADVREAALRFLGGATRADLEDAGAVVFYLPDPLLEDERRLLVALSRPLEVLVLAGRTGDEEADRAVEALVQDLAAESLEVGFGGAPSEGGDDAGGAGRPGFLSAPDEDVEVREAVRHLVAHAEAGGDLGRCAVTFPDGSLDLWRRLCDQLTEAGIPWSGGSPESLGKTPEARLLTGLVELALKAAAGEDLDRDDVFAWLSSGPLRIGSGLTAGLDEGGRLPLGAWDRCSRAAGVLGGIEQWRERLGAYASARAALARLRLTDAGDQEAEAADAPQEAAGTAVDAAVRAASDLLDLLERLHALLAPAMSARSWQGLAAWAAAALEGLLEPSGTRAALVASVGSLGLIDRLDPLGDIEPEERLWRFTRSLEVALEGRAGARGRFGTGPYVGPLSAVAGAGWDVCVLLGCKEGALPAPVDAGGLISPAEGEIPPGDSAGEAARRHLLSVLASAGEVVASYSRIDVRAGREVNPSPWAAELFTGQAVAVPSFAGSIRRVTEGLCPAADTTDFELAFAMGDEVWEVLEADVRRRRGAGRLRRQGGLSPYAGYVASSGGSDTFGEPMSATGLENFAVCPFRFFMDRKLHVRVLEPPERVVVIDPRDRGTLMHGVLEAFFADERFVTGELPVELDEAARQRLRDLASEAFAEMEEGGKTGKAIFWRSERERILRDLERYVARDLAETAAAGRRPVRTELEFGGEGDEFSVAAGPGQNVKFRGRIDRVDLTPAGDVVVVDYKSGRADDFLDIRHNPLGNGRHLQLPVYAEAALQHLGRTFSLRGGARAEYRFLQATAGYAVIPVELTNELDGELRETLETLVSTIDAGCFPPRPGPSVQGSQYKNCRYCDFDAVCTTDRAELWERASGDVEMKAYTALVEPR